jgi:hypothetical protein
VPKFGCDFGDTVAAFATAATVKTLARIATAAKKKVEIIWINCSGSGLVGPQDIQHSVTWAGLTGATAGTTTSRTPELLDQGGAAANSTVGVNASAEPTTYGSVFPMSFSFNQRGGDRWAVARGEGLFFDNADTQLNCGIRIQSNTPGNVQGAVQFWEP